MEEKEKLRKSDEKEAKQQLKRVFGVGVGNGREFSPRALLLIHDLWQQTFG